MSKVLLRLLGAALVLAVGIGLLVPAANARHIDADEFRGLGEKVAEAARSGDRVRLREAIDDLVDLVTGPPEDSGRPEVVPPEDSGRPEGIPPEGSGRPEVVPPEGRGRPEGVPPEGRGRPDDVPRGDGECDEPEEEEPVGPEEPVEQDPV